MWSAWSIVMFPHIGLLSDLFLSPVWVGFSRVRLSLSTHRFQLCCLESCWSLHFCAYLQASLFADPMLKLSLAPEVSGLVCLCGLNKQKLSSGIFHAASTGKRYELYNLNCPSHPGSVNGTFLLLWMPKCILSTIDCELHSYLACASLLACAFEYVCFVSGWIKPVLQW